MASRCTARAAWILVSARPSSLWKTARSLTVGPPGKRAVCIASSVMSSRARRARPMASGGTSLDTKAGMPSRNRSPPRTAGDAELVGHFLRHEDAVQREVEAAGALQPGDVPVIDDLRLRPWAPGRRPSGRTRFRRPVVGPAAPVAAVRLERPDQPVRVDDAAREAPPAADQVAARHRVPGAARHELARRPTGRAPSAAPKIRRAPSSGSHPPASPLHPAPIIAAQAVEVST